ncbi:hypothetical protein C7S20_04820 [Christiangramia fulva]|uniref:Uncharacterized protein n=1 Tax=Christiangramia fulva TaxID=2126553 RepID=A0A2R3Z2Z9_9FLAO|nr:hypothetical protein [Christiangramia fulva]AVR44637.1 hypothetical protein C7S20_04820 [Christiangramia fulva]
MRISLHPIKSLERDIKFSLVHSFLKLLFILGIAFLVFLITSKTYVPSAGINTSYEIIPQDTPPAPYSYRSS